MSRTRLLRLIPILVMAAGAAAVCLAFGSDLLGLSHRSGLGGKQFFLLLVGSIVFLVGLFLSLPVVQRTIGQVYAASPLPGNPGSLLLIAAWFGLVTGFAELSVLVTRKLLLEQIIFLSRDFIWMTPLASLAYFVLLGLAVALLAKLWPKWVSLQAAIFVYAFVMFLSLFLLFDGLHRAAALLLAAGLAAQVSRWIARHCGSFYALVRLTMGWTAFIHWPRRAGKQQAVAQQDAADSGPAVAPPAPARPTRRDFLLSTATVLCAIAVAERGRQTLAERRAVAALPDPAAGLPNVLLIVMDTVRAKSLDLYGYDRPASPYLTEMAKGGVTFERAIAPSSWTLPSHGSIFTARPAGRLSTTWDRPLDQTYPTLAEVLAARGYVTAGFTGNTMYTTDEFGLSRGFTHYDDYPVSAGQAVLSSSLGRFVDDNDKIRRAAGSYELLNRRRAADVSQSFLRWVDGARRRPFFAFVNYFDAHEPYLPPAEFALRFAPRLSSGHIDWDKKLSEQDIQALRDSYDGAIAYVDDQIGRLLAELKRRAVLDDTLVIITSDHGEQFGEHELLDHGNSLYLPLLHVPLVISLPSRLPAGMHVGDAVSLRDLAATVLDIAGLGPTGKLPGTSLARFWSASGASQASAAEPLLSEVEKNRASPAWYPGAKGPMKSIILDGMHYIRNYGDGREELYDIEHDWAEERDLAGSAASLAQLERMRGVLDDTIASKQS